MDKLWAIILAAGESKRMGSPKMMLPFNGRTMIEHVITNIGESKIERTMVVTGADKEPLVELMGELPVRVCYNENYREGMLSSVRCAFRNLPDFSAALVFQGDQPFITSRTINAVIDAYFSTGKGLIMPVYNGKRGHPLLIDRKYRDEIEKISPETGLRSLVYSFPEDVLEVNTNDSGILIDFDTFEQYKNGINQIK